ncbi:MAG TPA: class I SAM-dependent methyltransferase [Solirubrobacterales bacterium]
MPASFFPTDPDENAASLSNVAEILFGCLDAIEATTVVEIGAFHGKSTNEMLEWAARRGAKLIAIDPEPQPDLRQIAAGHPELELVEATSHEALPDLPAADAIIIDGDHNYFTLSEELRLIEARAPGPAMPLLMLHDIGWPLARRDGYYAPERIPAEHRQPLAHNTYLAPDEPATAADGMPFACVAAREGGPRNGILTAVEDFLETHPELAFARVPAFFGFGVIWHPQAHWAEAVRATVAPWDRNPVLERMEANRIRHMVERYRMTRRLEIAVDRAEQSDQVLRAIEGSRAFGVAEQLSRLHGRGRPAFSRDQVRRALDDRGPG